MDETCAKMDKAPSFVAGQDAGGDAARIVKPVMMNRRPSVAALQRVGTLSGGEMPRR